MLQKKQKAELSKPLGHIDRPVPRLISKPEVLDRVGVTFPTLWAWMRAGTFPRSRDLGGKACWLESEIDAWIENRPIRRLKGDPGARRDHV
jgi:predicted DNA-binding transcriptional regulator AlpA